MTSTAALRAVVFDLDGTLIDSRGDILAAANHALKKHGYEAPPAPTVLSYVGDGAAALLARCVKLDVRSAEVAQLSASFIEYYSAYPVEHTRFCLGAEDSLVALRGLPLALCTNKPRTTTDRVLAGLGLSDTFRLVVGGGDLPVNKPDPAPLHFIAEQLGVESTQLVMVGDGAQDIECGRRAGARTVGLRGGIQSEAALLAAKPDHLLDDLRGLADLLRSWQLLAAL